ncbi:MAG TPA: head maturation protease, ClpP-related, partial [Pseudonocardia sp.]
MTSIHVRRLQSRVERTTERLVDLASRQRLSVADLRSVRLPWYEVRNQAEDDGEDFATVFIFDEIGGSLGVTAKQFAADLEEITAPTIRVRINSPGGSVFDGIAIYNALRHHPARIEVYVDSLAASAASVIATAGDEVVMMPGSQMMIHDASALEDGNASDMAKMSTFLDRQSENIADMYQLKGGGEAAEWRELMKAETWMFAREAVEMGLADRVSDTRVTDGDPDAPRELAERMRRSFDLSPYRYAGRREAPAPRHRAVTAHRRGAEG